MDLMLGRKKDPNAKEYRHEKLMIGLSMIEENKMDCSQ
ncbi:hypothetical protein D515_01300 [Grimontia indica]|uniref:Uncharacterized protein n=1 Tax=Grimontia indica TaxID=1056512 RepID=R1IFK8_9GAMM|nr:hypothetical protein D515_01300 [Grimontia indica]